MTNQWTDVKEKLHTIIEGASRLGPKEYLRQVLTPSEYALVEESCIMIKENGYEEFTLFCALSTMYLTGKEMGTNGRTKKELPS